ncbi:MAG: hypothetical protein AMJ41_02485, partial [candidate division Zixibacteria bacterium DG_27]
MRKASPLCISLLLMPTIVVTLSCHEAPPPVFDEMEAFRFLEAQCSFGPRNPGSYGHQKCLDYLLQQLGACADTVFNQEFTHIEYSTGSEVKYTNLIVRFHLKKERRLILCAHWDTRPFADEDPDSSNWNRPILGANDGASGVAVLLEIAKILGDKKSRYGIDIVLFDGEDGGRK